MSKFTIPAVILVAVAVVLLASRKSSTTIEVGRIYSKDDGKGRYGVVKLLARADGTCPVRVYKKKFSARPTEIDVATLSLGKPGDPDGFGMGHTPLREARP